VCCLNTCVYLNCLHTLVAHLLCAWTLTVELILYTLAARVMCANWYMSWLLMCIGGTPYVCSHIILLSTPTIAGVTKIAHRERVPNGSLPKLGRVLTPLWGRTTPSKRRLAEDVHLCSINCYVIMRTCCCRELFLFDRRCTAKNYWPSKILSLTGIIGQDY